MDQPLEAIADETAPTDAFAELEDDSLRLIFTCCHPVLAPDAQVALNRAVAVAMHSGYEQGIALVDELLTLPAMQDYHLAHAARADWCRRLQRWDEARHSYTAALARVQLEPERCFLERRLSEISH